MDIKVKNGQWHNTFYVDKEGGGRGKYDTKKPKQRKWGKGENTTLKIKDCVYREKMGKKQEEKNANPPRFLP